MGIAKLYGQKASGTNINGIIKDYHAYAGENISAGDFVEYINGIASQRTETSEDTQLNSDYTGQTISAVQLDGNRVFIAHAWSGNNRLYGMVVTIDGTTITKGTDTALVTSDNSGIKISTVLLENGNVFVAHSYGSSRHLYGIVISINGTTITPGSDTMLVSSAKAGATISTELLSNGNVFIAHGGDSSYYLYGIVLTINGTEITMGTDTTLDSSQYSGDVISTCLLPSGDVFIAHSYSSSVKLYAHACTISGNTISVLSSTQLVPSTNAGSVISAELLKNGNVFVAHSLFADYYLYGIVCSISGTTITKGTDTELISGTHKSHTITTTLLSNGKMFIAHRDYSNCLYGVIATIDSNTITVGADTQLNGDSYSGYVISSILLNKNIFIAHSYNSNNYLHAQIFGIDEANNIPTNNVVITEYETQVRKTTTSQFDGVAKEIQKGTIEYETKLVQGDIVPKIWMEVTSGTEYVAEDGTKLTASSYKDSYIASNACDGTEENVWVSGTVATTGTATSWCKLEFPTPQKISKMKVRAGTWSGVLMESYIQGSNDNNNWANLYTFTTQLGSLTEVELVNVNYYKYYRILLNNNNSDNYCSCVREWQVSEYEGLVQKQGKDLVSIYTL